MIHNQIFAAIRKRIIQQDVNITSDVDPDYLVFPLSQLDVLLQQRKIYFYDNVSIIKKIETKIPKTIDWDEISAQLRRNFVFHESCHVVSRAVSKKYFANSITLTILEESFSNTCELLAVKDVDDAVHAAFFEFSSYIVHFELKTLINELVQEIGFEKVFQWTLLTYMHTNFLVKSLDDKRVSRLFQYLGITPSAAVAKRLKSLSKVAFQLNPDFLNATTGFYLKYNLIEDTPQNIQKIDFMSQLENDSRYLQFFSELSVL